MNLSTIFENNKNWIQKKLDEDSNYFINLAKGQAPEMLFIGCSDSRVSISDIMGVEPGDAFVHRNIANLVPVDDLNAKSVINYAVCHLKIKHIVVCGHYNCGGVQAAMGEEDLGELNPWIEKIKHVYRLHETNLNSIDNYTERYKKFVELNVKEQCNNVLKNKDVLKAHTQGDLKLHGWVFDIENGKLIDLALDF